MGLRRTEQIRVPERLKLDLPHPSRQPADPGTDIEESA